MTIFIRNLRLNARIGVSDQERSSEQEIVISLSIDYDADKACQSDSIIDALDYRQIRDQVITLVEASDVRLIETLAQRVAALLAEDARISHLRVEIQKPAALRQADSVAACLDWVRGS